MHNRLISYLRDNRDHIIENWLTEADIPAPVGFRSDAGSEGAVPFVFFANAFEEVLQRVEFGADAKVNNGPLHMSNFLGVTCECKQRCFGGRVCMELHDSGLSAFMSVFDEQWDTGHEFNELDRECCQDLINHALSGFFGREVELCAHRALRSDCPFAAQD